MKIWHTVVYLNVYADLPTAFYCSENLLIKMASWLGHSNLFNCFMNSGMQTVGRHKYEFISLYSAAFS